MHMWAGRVAGIAQQRYQRTLGNVIALMDFQLTVMRVERSHLRIVAQNDDVAIAAQSVAGVNDFGIGYRVYRLTRVCRDFDALMFLAPAIAELGADDARIDGPAKVASILLRHWRGRSGMLRCCRRRSARRRVCRAFARTSADARL